MLLSKIISKDIKPVKIIGNNPDITGIDHDSRRIKKGMIFAAIEGEKINGIRFCDKAIQAGAKVILCNKKDSEKILGKEINILTSKNVKLSTTFITKMFFPKQPKNIVAITGTNGKTSIAFFLYNIWKQLNYKGASIGTLGIKYSNKNIQTQLTTPDPVSLIKNLDFLERKNIDYVAVEASSHGLQQKRIDLIKVNRGIFSNLSRDHLDYHKTLDNYFKSKKKLFSEVLNKKGLALFGPHKPAKLVSIEREKFKAIQVEDLNKLSAEKVFERILGLLT